ncbi:MSP (Major sperm protein) domain-containing protein [Ditylenchus destructor]|nr:MSP (Major sperm protein) domain-containing protein [Ditylenchus destructor]
MSKQILMTTPVYELTFNETLLDTVYTTLRLKNPSSRDVFYKIKTTAPHIYCVRPSYGLVKPNETANITISIQKGETVLEIDRIRHRFLVQSAYAPDKEVSAEAFWKDVNQSEIMSSKLKVASISTDESKNINPMEKSDNEGSKSVQDETVSALQKQLKEYKETMDKAIFEKNFEEHEKKKLEKEVGILKNQLDKVVPQCNTGGIAGFPVSNVIIIAFIAFIFGVIIGKLLD